MNGDVRDEFIGDVVELVCNHIFTRKGLEEYCLQSSNVHLEWFMDFNEIPVAERLHMIPHSFDKLRIQQRNECITLAREYMNTIKPINNIIKL